MLWLGILYEEHYAADVDRAKVYLRRTLRVTVYG